MHDIGEDKLDWHELYKIIPPTVPVFLYLCPAFKAEYEYMISYLQIDKLTKSFGDLILFEDITFGIAQGQKVGLIAKNGTGKRPC